MVISVVTQRRGTHSANRADLRRVSTGAVLGQGCALLCGATTGVWSRQRRKPWSFPRVQFLDKVVVDIPVAAQRQLPVWEFTAVNTHRQVPAVLGVQTVRKAMEFPQLHAGESSF